MCFDEDLIDNDQYFLFYPPRQQQDQEQPPPPLPPPPTPLPPDAPPSEYSQASQYSRQPTPPSPPRRHLVRAQHRRNSPPEVSPSRSPPELYSTSTSTPSCTPSPQPSPYPLVFPYPLWGPPPPPTPPPPPPQPIFIPAPAAPPSPIVIPIPFPMPMPMYGPPAAPAPAPTPIFLPSMPSAAPPPPPPPAPPAAAAALPSSLLPAMAMGMQPSGWYEPGGEPKRKRRRRESTPSSTMSVTSTELSEEEELTPPESPQIPELMLKVEEPKKEATVPPAEEVWVREPPKVDEEEPTTEEPEPAFQEEPELPPPIIMFPEYGRCKLCCLFLVTMVPCTLLVCIVIPASFYTGIFLYTAGNNYCYTGTCVQDASSYSLLGTIESGDKCYYFYEYVCYNFNRVKFVPFRHSMTAWTTRTDHMKNTLKKALLYRASEVVAPTSHEEKMLLMFQSCFNSELLSARFPRIVSVYVDTNLPGQLPPSISDGGKHTTDDDSMSTIKRNVDALLKSVFGPDFPASFGGSVEGATGIIGAKYAVFPIAKVDLRQRYPDRKDAVILMTLPDLMLHPRLYKDVNEVTRPEQAFEINDFEVSELIRDALNFFGFSIAPDEAEAIFRHDTTLAQVYMDARNDVLDKSNLAVRGVRFDPMPKMNKWNWTEFFDAFGMSVQPSTVFKFDSIVYYHNLAPISEFLVEKSNLTARYLALRLLLSLTPALTDSSGDPAPLNELYNKYHKDYLAAPPRFMACIDVLEHAMPHVLSVFFMDLIQRQQKADKHHPAHFELRAVLRSLIRQNLTTTADRVYSFSSHTNAKSRVLSYRKMKSMHIVVFTPKKDMPSHLPAIYQGANSGATGTLLENALSYLEAGSTFYWNHITGFNDSSSQNYMFVRSMFSEYCEYIYDTNTLFVPLGIMYGHNYMDLEANVFRKAKIIFKIMRGIMKAYDTIGAFINERGMFENWISGYALQQTSVLERCIQRNIRREMKPPLSVVENYVDFIAMKGTATYYRKLVRTLAYPRVDYRLDAYKILSSQELFFHAIGEDFCQRIRKLSRPRFRTDDFTLNRLRVKYVFDSMEFFLETYACVKRTKCKVLESDRIEEDKSLPSRIF